MLGTLKRAGDVLDLFTIEEPEWGVTAAAQRLGIGKSLAHDALTSLAAIGLLQRVGHGHYRLGWRTLSLASILVRTSELTATARPVVRELAERRGLGVSLVAWDRGRIVYIDRRHMPRGDRAIGPVAGTIAPVDGNAASQVLLANRPAAEVASLWGEGFVQTPHTSLDELERDLARIRVHGWAGDGDGAVAAPVRDGDGDVAAAISVDLARICAGGDVRLHAGVVVAAATKISRAMRG
jgi:DNA-binding IclR family transcriptional regulator